MDDGREGGGRRRKREGRRNVEREGGALAAGHPPRHPISARGRPAWATEDPAKLNLWGGPFPSWACLHPSRAPAAGDAWAFSHQAATVLPGPWMHACLGPVHPTGR